MSYNILFVCKFNRLRSVFAEAYFKAKNTNPKLSVRSGGLFQGEPIDEAIREAARSYGVELKAGPEAIAMELLCQQHMVVIVADDVPPSIFNDHRIPCRDNIVVWDIPDTNKSLPVIAEEVQKLIQSLSHKS